MVETLLNLVVQGVLIGGLYALFALGLSLSLGVMRFVNIAHGDMIVLFSFVLLSLTGLVGWSPFLVALILTPAAFGVGYMLQRVLLQRTVGKGVLPILLVTFGLSIIIQNGLLEAYGANTRKLMGGAVELAAFRVGPIDVGVFPLLVFLLAVGLIAGLDAFLYRTSIGARIRAVSDDPAAADLIGLSAARVYPVAMGVVGITMMAAAACMSVWTNFDPAIGPSGLLAAFEAVVLGGLGSLWG
ncbi:MAG TPA: branched-chain amino acid ABC transporter permease, partial [Roseiarcus sp.]|nr:branched-chain amino acid ABC transporter permease [Roseiarcus sp.]